MITQDLFLLSNETIIFWGKKTRRNTMCKFQHKRLGVLVAYYSWHEDIVFIPCLFVFECVETMFVWGLKFPKSGISHFDNLQRLTEELG